MVRAAVVRTRRRLLNSTLFPAVKLQTFQYEQMSGVFKSKRKDSLYPPQTGDLCGLDKDHGYLLLPQEPFDCTFGLWVLWE